jgi:hypothetical protein
MVTKAGPGCVWLQCRADGKQFCWNPKDMISCAIPLPHGCQGCHKGTPWGVDNPPGMVVMCEMAVVEEENGDCICDDEDCLGYLTVTFA